MNVYQFMQKFNFKTDVEGEVDKNLASRPAVTKVEMLFDGQRFLVDLEKDLSINEANLTQSMIDHAGTYGWWASIVALTKRKYREAKRELEEKTTSLDLEARSSLQLDKIKVTEAGVKAYIENDSRVKKIREKLIPLEDMVEFVELMLRSLENKRDMLKEINRSQCRERFNQD